METVAEKVNSSIDSLSPASRRIARALLADYPSAGLGTTSSLADLANSSSASVVRFCTQLGFDSFVELQDRLRTELTTRSASPLIRAEAETAARDLSDEFSSSGMDRANLITRTFQQNPRSEIDRLVQMLTKVSNRVVVVGGHYSGLVGRVAQLQLSKVRPSVSFLEDPMGRDLHVVTDLRRQDLLLVLDVRRYQEHLFQVSEAAKRNSASVALITDQWLSPVAGISDVVLQAAVDVSFFDSQVGCLALVEAVVHEAATKIDGALERLRALEELRPSQRSK
ncbi:DNA-binding MurR/RpiR family transcriptional regulator [Brevibacterium epidermidis]|jgi:DNA-binding MurR/RpiR family transcriptional regulator|uniref:DNA-binding MurR/RpiR family transcriptional regulator n=1 Tax=Brevibacterium epidermidis TaxID=1698 RepID=A0ABV4EGL7_BREEP